MQLSVVVPIYNEEDNILPMYEAVKEALELHDYELLFVDDGSHDETVKRVTAIEDPRVRLVTFSRNYGQTSAMAAGILEARGEYIVTMDGDLQNDPRDIPMMLEVLEDQSLDMVVGKRMKRQDGMILRKLPSKIANGLIRWSTGIKVSDYGCTLKLFRSEIARKLDLYGELHRFIPILSAMNGARFEEVGVRHRAREHGTSKYGIGRTLRVVSDLMLMLFFMKYRQRPMHLFGSIGIGLFLMGGLIEAYLLLQKMFGEDIGGRPLFYIGILMLIMSVQFITAGFLSELIMRTYFESQNKKPYTIAGRYQGGKLLPPES